MELRSKPTIPWGPFIAIAATVGIYLGSQIVAEVFLAIYGSIRGMSVDQISGWLSQSITAQFAFSVMLSGLSLWLVYLFLRNHKLNFRDIGLQRFRIKDIGWAILGYAMYLPVFLIAITGADRLFPQIDLEQEQQLGFDNIAGGWELGLVFVSLVVLPPLVEEILMRGFLYTSLRAKWPRYLAVVVTSMLFALAHLQFGSGAPLLWVAAIDTFTLSLILIYLRDTTGKLWASIGLHAIKNFIAFLALFIFHV